MFKWKVRQMKKKSQTFARQNVLGEIYFTSIGIWTLVCFAYTVIPFTPYVLPQGIRYILTIFLLLLAVHIVSSEDIYIPMSVFVAQVVFFLCLWIGRYSHVNGSSLINSLSRYIMFWSPMYVSLAIFKRGIDGSKYLLNFLKIGYLITMITTLQGNIKFPEVSRLLAGAATESQIDFYGRLNIGGYGFIYSIVMFMPIWIYNVFLSKKKFKDKVLDFVLIVVGIITIYISNYSTAVLLCLFEVLLFFLQKSKNKEKIIRGVVLLMILAILLKNQIAKAVLSLSIYMEGIGNELMAIRLDGIYCLLVGIEPTGDVAKRSLLYTRSWEAFLQSPLYGNLFGGNRLLGGHSELLDLLGSSGIIGFIPFITLFIFYIRSAASEIDPDIRYVYYIVLVSFFILLSINTVFRSLDVSFVLFAAPALFLCEKTEDSDGYD